LNKTQALEKIKTEIDLSELLDEILGFWIPVPVDLPNNLLLFVKCLLTSFARGFPYERKRFSRKARIETKG